MQTSTDKPSVSPADGGAEAWTGGFASGSFASEGGFGQPLGESESDESREQPFKKSAVRSTVGPRPRSRPNDGAQEVLNVTALPDKEGMFLFQYRNYEISSSRRATKVIRRYSDFVWLLDCLHKRYPFRQLPLLPPKRVSSKPKCSVSLQAMFQEIAHLRKSSFNEADAIPTQSMAIT